MIKLKNVTKSFGTLDVIKDLSYNFSIGEVTCLLGPSGCGKSTILKMISKLDNDYTGTIEGLENMAISYVFQESRLVPWLTVRENLNFVLEGQIEKNLIDDKIDFFLDKVGLREFENAYPSTLSGGMKQRVSLARAFSMPHDILLMDEPFQGLDKTLKDQLMTLLEDLIEFDKKTVILVTHDIREARRLGDTIIELNCKPISHANKI